MPYNPNMIIWDKFKKLWPNYLFQSALAGIAIFVIVVIVKKENVVIISSIGATAFISFAMPQSISAHARNVIGGHSLALVCGMIFTATVLPAYIEFPLAISIAIFFMVALDVEHPPAAGTVLAVTINEVTPTNAVVILLSSVAITLCRHYMRNILKDLI